MKVAINGFGRIGRLVFRLTEENSELEVVAINDLSSAKELSHLLKYDTNHRTYRKNEISYDEDEIIINNRKVKVYKEVDPSNLPWADLGIDLVFECSGHFTDLDKAMAHINAGAKKVIISAPAKGDLKTIVYNVNHQILDGQEQIISAASCTTNCLAPVLKPLQDMFGIEKGYMTTVHAYTNDQTILDVPHKKGIEARRGRAGAANIIPASTGAASAIGLVLPDLKGKLEGMALRVPVPDGSCIDLTLELKKAVIKEELNKLFGNSVNETLEFTMDPVVSSDIIGSFAGGLVDGLCTNVLEIDGKQLIKIIAWYDNEMGYTAQMVRTAIYWLKK